ncbi:MAG: DUF945 family protein [Pseudomonadota bacterium]
MRKFITILAIALIAVALIGPGLMGRVAEKALNDSNSEIARSLPPWIEMVEQDFDRGWFASGSRYRLAITDRSRLGPLIALFGEGVFADQPAVIVQSRVAHGPLVGLFTPALAQADSRFIAETGNEQPAVLPLALRTTLGLTGNATFDWLVREGSAEHAAGSARWQDMTLRHFVAADLSRTTLDLSAPLFEIVPADSSVAMNYQDVDISLTLLQEGSLLRSGADYALTIEGDEGSVTTEGQVTLNGIELSALPALNTLVARLTTAKDRQQAYATLQANLPALREVLASQVSLDWNQSVATSNGAIQSNLAFELPTSSQLPAANNIQVVGAAVLQLSKATVYLSLAPEFVAAASEGPDEVKQAIAMMRGTGMLIDDDDTGQFVTDLAYADGLLTVNGMPMPVAAPPSE